MKLAQLQEAQYAGDPEYPKQLSEWMAKYDFRALSQDVQIFVSQYADILNDIYAELDARLEEEDMPDHYEWNTGREAAVTPSWNDLPLKWHQVSYIKDVIEFMDDALEDNHFK